MKGVTHWPKGVIRLALIGRTLLRLTGDLFTGVAAVLLLLLTVILLLVEQVVGYRD